MRIVALGGGTGLSTLLRGIKRHTSEITAIVTVADDGGSSGRIRHELRIPAPGDIRSTLLALAEAEPLMQRLFDHRFSWGEGLQGHSFGNLFIAAMTEITGDFEVAIKESSRVLAVRGRVVPSTLEDVELRAEFDDGTWAHGESSIPAQHKRIKRIELEPPDCEPVDEALSAIAEADAVILGPGSLYTSVIPNLLVKRISEEILRCGARRIYVCNVMTQPGETDGYKASDHVKALIAHAGAKLIDDVLVNSQPIPPELELKYREQGAQPVEADLDCIREMGIRVWARPMLSASELVRHDPEALALAIMDVLED